MIKLDKYYVIFLVLVAKCCGYFRPMFPRLQTRLKCSCSNVPDTAIDTSPIQETILASSSTDDVRVAFQANISKAEQLLTMLKENVADIDSKIEMARNEYAVLNAEYGGEIGRLLKEFERIRERTSEEHLEAIENSKIEAIKDILPSLDNFVRAQQAFQPVNSVNEKRIVDYYSDIFNKLSDLVNSYGVTRIESVGTQFDVAFMQALQSMPSELPAGTVMIEYQPGYKAGNKCIFPALVVVSSGPSN